jgi:hypothetical protein
MKTPQSVPPRFRRAYVLTPALTLLTAGILIGVVHRPSASLSASASPPPADMDFDGLVDGQELILGTIASVSDSDLDGYSDAEELARKTSPLVGQFHPEAEVLDVGITARGDQYGLHALVAIYLLPNIDLRDVQVRVGILVGRRMVFLPPARLLNRGTLEFVPGLAPNSTVALIDLRFNRNWVDTTGHLTMFATVSMEGSSTISAAATMDLFNIGGVVVLAMPDPTSLPGSHDDTGLTNQSFGTVFKPLTLEDFDPPAGWTLGEVCFQTSQSVGTGGGAVVVHEISSAECQEGWEGACPPSCSSSVGSTFTTVDPAMLVGG